MPLIKMGDGRRSLEEDDARIQFTLSIESAMDILLETDNKETTGYLAL